MQDFATIHSIKQKIHPQNKGGHCQPLPVCLPAWRGSRFAEISRNLEHLLGGFIHRGFQSMATPKSSVCVGCSNINYKPSRYWGTAIYGNPTHLLVFHPICDDESRVTNISNMMGAELKVFQPPTRDEFVATTYASFGHSIKVRSQHQHPYKFESRIRNVNGSKLLDSPMRKTKPGTPDNGMLALGEVGWLANSQHVCIICSMFCQTMSGHSEGKYLVHTCPHELVASKPCLAVAMLTQFMEVYPLVN